MKKQHTTLKALALLLMANFLCSAVGVSQSNCPGETNESGPITPCLLKDGCDPGASPIGDPYIYEGECSIGLNRYLSRAADVGKLAELLFINERDSITKNPIEECVSPYNMHPITDYCPEKYCAMIQSLVDMDIQFLQRAYWGAYGHEHQFYPGGEPYYELGKQIIRDINYAYDCAGKRRPIIQGTAWDNIDPGNFPLAEKYNNNPINRNIPTCMITKYFEEFPLELDEIDPDFETTHHPKRFRDYYFEPGLPLTPRTDRFFEKNRIGVDGPGDNNKTVFYPKIAKLEFRMFLLYQAWTQIEMGYTALHMGIYFSYAASEAPSYDKLYGVTTAIRNYAAANGSFVLLSGETPMGLSAKHGETDEFIFDFDSRAMRPREILGGVSGDGNACNQPIAQSIQDEINSSPCASYELNAVVDPCTINSFGGTSGGISPQGCYVSQQPYTVHFDGFSAPNYPGVPSNGPSSLTYGFHDHQWFSQLPEDCRLWWFDHFYCDRRNYHNGNGFIVIPGIILYDSDITIENEGAEQLISDNQEFVDMLANVTLAPKTPTISILIKPAYESTCSEECHGIMAPPGWSWLLAKSCYEIKIENKDCSSTYSIHIKDPNGNWLPQVLGDTYNLCPEESGVYEISIRQDNLGLPAATFGTRTITVNEPLNSTICWELVEDYKCWWLRTTPVCTEFDDYKRTYEFSIESETQGDVIRNIRPVDAHLAIRNALQPTAQSMTGFIDVRDDRVTQMELLVDVERSGVISTTYTKAQLPDCNQAAFSPRNTPVSKRPHEKSIQLFPNPANQQLNIQYYADLDEEITLLIYNSIGQVQYTDQIRMTTGENSWHINTAQLPTGNYMLFMRGERINDYKKFVKKGD